MQGDLFAICMESIIVNIVFNNSNNGMEVIDTRYPWSELEMIVLVQGVLLTSYLEGIIVNTVSNNSDKGRAIMELVVEKLSRDFRHNVCHLLQCPVLPHDSAVPRFPHMLVPAPGMSAELLKSRIYPFHIQREPDITTVSFLSHLI